MRRPPNSAQMKVVPVKVLSPLILVAVIAVCVESCNNFNGWEGEFGSFLIVL